MPAPSSSAAAALIAVQRQWSFRFEAVQQSTMTELRELTVESCSITNNSLADKVQRTCDVKLAASSPFSFLNELFRPYAVLTDPASGVSTEWCLGTFLLSSNVSSELTTAGDSSAACTGYDRLLALDEQKVSWRFSYPAGTNPTTEVAATLASVGFQTGGVVAQSKTLPAPLEWEPGTPLLTVINDLLASVGYSPLAMNELGQPVAAPYVDPAAAEVVWKYAADASSVILPGVDTTLDLFNVPNEWTAYVSEPDRPVLRSTYTNTNPASPTSTVSRGRTISQVVQLQQSTGDAPPGDQATLDAKVQQMAQQSSQVYSDVEFTTGLMPFHGNAEVFTLDTGKGPIRYREHTWSLDLVAGGKMRHRFRRVVLI
jgi:hypothetical protein